MHANTCIVAINNKLLSRIWEEAKLFLTILSTTANLYPKRGTTEMPTTKSVFYDLQL